MYSEEIMQILLAHKILRRHWKITEDYCFGNILNIRKLTVITRRPAN